jgi:N-acyl-D-amino-acid deacylase
MDLLIQGGTVVDGLGGPPRRADVRVRQGRIAEIGEGLGRDGEAVIDASGAYVTPGFIDTHTHFDASLYWDPLCDPMLQHGVTTVLIGNCGLGLAPLRKEDREGLVNLFAYIEDLPVHVLRTEIPWAWEDFPGYAQDMAQRSFGPNVSLLVSHSLLRQWVMGEDAWSRAATPAEVARMTQQLDEALKSGARGLSSSFFDRTAQGDFVPSAFADDAEFDSLFRALGVRGAICQIIPRLWSCDLAIEDLERLGALAGPHKVTIISNGIYQRPGEPTAHLRLQDCARRLEAAGARVRHLASPRPIELPLRLKDCFAFGTIGAWREAVNTAGDKAAMLRDPDWRARARADWADSSFSRWIERTRITHVARAELQSWVGRSLADLAAERGGDSSDVMADWFLENDLQAQFVVPISNLDYDAVGAILADPVNLISGSDAGAHYQMFSGAGDSTLVLTRHVRERSDLTLELAVKKMTADQAELLGLSDRGALAPDKVADIAIFALEELHWGAEYMVEDVPGGGRRFTRPPGGVRHTIVNGVLAHTTGAEVRELPGRMM